MKGTPADKNVEVGITLPISLVKQVDKVRRDVPRSTFIRRALEIYLKREKAN
jgi:metal-responsive CopG/Arc/MetJ family transcriptional regulator